MTVKAYKHCQLVYTMETYLVTPIDVSPNDSHSIVQST